MFKPFLAIAVLPFLFLVTACNTTVDNASLEESAQTSTAVQETADTASSQSHPQFILDMLAKNKSMDAHEQALEITRYDYHGKQVYYVKPPCCDFFSKVYDSQGNLLGAPDGGMTGRGDGKLTDFHAAKSNAFGLWKKKSGK